MERKNLLGTLILGQTSFTNIGIFTRKLFAGNKYIYLISFVLIIKIICNKMQKYLSNMQRVTEKLVWSFQFWD